MTVPAPSPAPDDRDDAAQGPREPLGPPPEHPDGEPAAGAPLADSPLAPEPPAGTAPAPTGPPPPVFVPGERRPSQWGPLAVVYTVAAGIWMVLWTFAFQTGTWVLWQVAVLQDAVFGREWAAVTVGNAIVAALALIPMLFMRRWPLLWAVTGLWLSAAAILMVTALPKIVPGVANAVVLAAQGVLALLIAGATWLVRLRRRPAGDSERAPARFWWAAAAGGVTLLPWIWAGGLGGLWETLAAVVAAAGTAALAATAAGDRFWRPFIAAGGWRRVLGGGAAVGVALYVIGATTGGLGVHLLVMLVAAALGFAVAALQHRPHRTGPVVALAVGPAAFGPLAFLDPDEFAPLVLGPEDFGLWAGIAVLAGVLAAWVIGAVYGGAGRSLPRRPAVAAATATVVAVAAGAVYATAAPGLHGEHVLVVLDSRADLSGVEALPDRAQRHAEIYRRLVEHAEASQADLRAELDRRGVDYTPYYLVNAIEVDAGLSSRLWLDDRDDVAAVLLAPQLRPVPAPAPQMRGGAEPRGVQPNIAAIGADDAWAEGVDGSGVTIGIADSGVDGTHPALADRFRGGGDSWFDPNNGSTAPVDPNGHGTHALGLALGAYGIGVAPGADWIGCANLPRNLGNAGDYLACLQFMFAPFAAGEDPFTQGDPSRAPDIVTNSWGCPRIEGCDRNVLEPAVDTLTAAGVFVVVAAGNSGPACGSVTAPPAVYPSAYTVAAVDDDGRVAGFSSRGGGDGPRPDIGAPGVNVLSALPGGGYGRLSGTSMATPHVAGTVALLWQADPELLGDVDATAAVLRETATPITGTLNLLGAEVDGPGCGGAANLAGAGVIDAGAAVERVLGRVG